MQIVHVDENGRPDQSIGLVLKKVLALQILIWSTLLLVFSLSAAVLWIVRFSVANVPLL